MHSRLILTTVIALSSLPALADTTTVTTNITLSTTTSGPITCDMVLDSDFVNTSEVFFTTRSSALKLEARKSIDAAGLFSNHVSISATLEVLGETGSSIGNLGVGVGLSVGSGTPGFNTSNTGRNNTNYHFGLSSEAYSGSVRITGAFADGVRFTLTRTAGVPAINMDCYGNGSVELFFNGTLSQ